MRIRLSPYSLERLNTFCVWTVTAFLATKMLPQILMSIKYIQVYSVGISSQQHQCPKVSLASAIISMHFCRFSSWKGSRNVLFRILILSTELWSAIFASWAASLWWNLFASHDPHHTDEMESRRRIWIPCVHILGRARTNMVSNIIELNCVEELSSIHCDAWRTHIVRFSEIEWMLHSVS